MNGFTEIAMSGHVLLAVLVSALAGLVSFASPCVIPPLVPGYLSYLAAVVGVDEQSQSTSRSARLRVTAAAGLFIAGFTAVFLMGTIAILGLTATVITNQVLLQRIGGAVTILMGLVFMGFVPALQRQARFTPPKSMSTIAGAPLLGGGVRPGLDPPVSGGPTLTGVIAMSSATNGSAIARGVVLVVAYCLGLGIPFVLLALGSARAVHAMGWLRRNTREIQIFGGVLLVAVGLALVSGLWNEFISWVRDTFVTNTTLPI